MKSLYTLGNKIIEQESLEVEGVFLWDYPDFCDAFFSYGLDINGTKLNDEELDLLTEKYSELVNELSLKSMFE
jgi:hypothetical protein